MMGGDAHIRRTHNSNYHLFNSDTRPEFGLGRTKNIRQTLRKVCPLAERLRRGDMFEDDIPVRVAEVSEMQPQVKRPLKVSKSDENWSILHLLNQETDATDNDPKPSPKKASEFVETADNLRLYDYSRKLGDDPRLEHRRGTSGMEPRRLSRSSGDGWAFSGLQTPLPPMESDGNSSDSDDELLFGRRQSVISSSGSSMSWAEDAFENGQTNEMKSLWRDIENACEGNGKADGMTNGVYEECLQWRRAFPAQCSAPSRFKFMMELENDGEDSTPTPTNETSAREQFSVLDASLSESRAEDCSTPNPETSTEYVSSWLSQCQIRDEGNVPETNEFGLYRASDEERINSAESMARLLGQKPSSVVASTRLSSSSNARVHAMNSGLASPIFPKVSSKSAYPSRGGPSQLPKPYAEPNDTRGESYRGRVDGVRLQLRSDRLGSTNVNSRGLSSASWSRHANNPNTNTSSNFTLPVEQEDENADTFPQGENQRKFGTPRPTQRPSYLPIHRPAGGTGFNHVDTNYGRNNMNPKPVKPFMFWLFNNVSPN